MPVSKIKFKTNQLDVELENVEFTVGPEIVKAEKLKCSLDVSDLLLTRMPAPRAKGSGVQVFSYGDKKIQCIKVTRAFTGWELREAKAFIESLPNFIPVKGNPVIPGFAGVTPPWGNPGEKELKGYVAALKEEGGEASIVREDGQVAPTLLDVLRDALSEALSKEVD